MALSGSCVVKATGQNNLIFSWAATQDIQGNRSKVSWQMQLTAGQYGRIVATPGSPWEVTIAGEVFSGTTDLSIENSETKVLASGEIWLDHDSLGARSFDFAFRQEFWIHFDGESIRVISGSGSAVLDDIPRASQPSAPASADLGQAITIATNRVSSFTHTLEYSFGNTSGVIARGVGDGFTWTPPLELAKQIPKATSGIAVISCTTYDAGKAIGTKKINLTLEVPDSVTPTASAVWEDLSGADASVGTLVQNISKLSVSVSGTGAYGSTIVSAAVTLDGKSYSGGVIPSPGEIKLAVTVTDSRGRKGKKSYTLTVAPYASPTVKLTASRCDENGNADENGDHARITVAGVVTQVGGNNTATLKLKWGSQSGSVSITPESYSYEKIVSADPDKTHKITATVTDRLTQSSQSMILSTGYATLDLLAGGKGIALGKAATREGFECAMPAFFTGSLQNKVIYYDLTSQELTGMTLEQVLDQLIGGMENNTLLHIQFYDPQGLRDNKFLGSLWRYTANYATLEAVTYTGYRAIKRKSGGTWQSWEWENPPLEIGKEFLTTEKWKGKPVYTMAFEGGALPAAGAVDIKTIPGKVEILDLRVTAKQPGNGYATFPLVNGAGGVCARVMAGFDGTDTVIGVSVYEDLSDHTVCGVVRYIK